MNDSTRLHDETAHVPPQVYLINDSVRVLARSYQEAIDKYAKANEGRYPMMSCCPEHEHLWTFSKVVEINHITSIRRLGEIVL